MNIYLAMLILLMPLFSCVVTKNNFPVDGVYNGRNKERNYHLELNKDSTFRFENNESCFPPFSIGRWYKSSHNSILLVRNTTETQNPLFLLSQVFTKKKIKMKFKSNGEIEWKDEDHKIHILYRK